MGNMTDSEYLMGRIKELLLTSGVVLPKQGEVKLYHHKGIDRFNEVGAIFISVIQNDYCKFIVAMLGGQSYPVHYHRIKDESYFILYGDLKVTIEDETSRLEKGDVINVPRRFMHSFSTERGCVFEEVSTAYLNNDSVYDDESIRNIEKKEKVTVYNIPEFLRKIGCNEGKRS